MSLHARPFFLPDGRRFLYLSRFVECDGGPGLRGLAGFDRTHAPAGQRSIRPTSSIHNGHLLFVRDSTLMAQPFDPERLALTGEAFPVAEQIQTLGSPAYGFFSASDSGALAYQTGRPAGAPQLTWLDRTGQVLGTVGKPAAFTDVALAPDGRRAVASLPDQRGDSDLWLIDLARDGLATRFTFDATQKNSFPIWSPDGSQIAFGSTRSGTVRSLSETVERSRPRGAVAGHRRRQGSVELVPRRPFSSVAPPSLRLVSMFCR